VGEFSGDRYGVVVIILSKVEVFEWSVLDS
jgi:hypothetical protein